MCFNAELERTKRKQTRYGVDKENNLELTSFTQIETAEL